MSKDIQPTQAFIDIAQIKGSLIITKNFGLRLIMLCSAVNFDLKTEEEQDILVAQYQNFLNSLTFPIQIVVHSRKMELGPYLDKLKKRLRQEENELLKIQMADYIAFLEELIPQANIMDKKFYVVVPYNPPLIKTPSLKSKTADKKLTGTEFETFKKEVIQRANVVASGLGSLGLRCVQLDNHELVELFYGIYNLDLAKIESFLEEQGESKTRRD
ncbi:MAG: hypothetical protein NT135_01355 [Candidatus Berkelbacteria bacterium]|nr:hypothetical protein [Candidatus Berkelbacteria bacterium]